MNNLELQIKMIDGTMPNWGDLGNGGLDLYSAEQAMICKGMYNVIRLGIATSFGSSYVGLLRDRSSMAAKGLSSADRPDGEARPIRRVPSSPPRSWENSPPLRSPTSR